MPPAAYPIHPRYRFCAVASALLALLFAYDLTQRVQFGSLLFFAVTLGLAVWYGRSLGSRVVVEGARLTLYTPLAAPQVVEFRQLTGVNAEGRGGKALLLLYHPLREHGLLDLESVRTLTLPEVAGQERLLELLAKQVRG
jgi:hypothetical protein